MAETQIPGIGSCGPRVVALSGDEIERRMRLITKYLQGISHSVDYKMWRDRLLSLFLCSDDAAIDIILQQPVPETLIMLNMLIQEGNHHIETGPTILGQISKEDAERIGVDQPRRV